MVLCCLLRCLLASNNSYNFEKYRELLSFLGTIRPHLPDSIEKKPPMKAIAIVAAIVISMVDAKREVVGGAANVADLETCRKQGNYFLIVAESSLVDADNDESDSVTPVEESSSG